MARDTTLRREPVLRSGEPPVLRGGEPANRGAEPALRDVLVTTTPTVEGRPVSAYLGLVTGEVVTGADLLNEAPAPKGLFARFRAQAPAEGGFSLAQAREKALRDLRSRAAAKGADAVVGVSVGLQVVGDSLVVTAIGTAVKLG